MATHQEGESAHLALGEAISRWERLQEVRRSMKDYERLQDIFRTDNEKLEVLKTSLQSVEGSLQILESKWKQLVAQEETHAKQQEQYH